MFAWALPLWTFVEVATSAARARRAFGPEIRLRIFWEQIARIVFALGFFAARRRLARADGRASLLAGDDRLALRSACSAAITTCSCCSARRCRAAWSATCSSPALGLLPSNLARRALIDAPPVVLNLMLPGARGAAAAGLFEIARKISTVPLIVRQAFQYVLGPLSSAQAHADRAQVAPLYHFASRVSTALVVPLAGLLVFAGVDILSLYRPEAQAALPLLFILVGARAIEAIVGPASAIVEMIGHRALPLLNSFIAIAAVDRPRRRGWCRAYGALGMAVAIGVATVASTYAATIELQISDGLNPFDRKLFQALALALAGVALMALAERSAPRPRPLRRLRCCSGRRRPG